MTACGQSRYSQAKCPLTPDAIKKPLNLASKLAITGLFLAAPAAPNLFSWITASLAR